MKNGLLKSFVGVFTILNACFFWDFYSFFIILSDFFYEGLNLKFDIMAIIISVLALVLFAVFLVFFFKHKDKNTVVTTVEFEKPDDMTPVEVGYLVDGVIDDEDLSALFVYWASKNYIEISKDKNQKLKKLVEELPENAKAYEKGLFRAIFRKDKEISVSDVSGRLENTGLVSKIVSDIEKETGEKYFDKKVLWIRQIFIVLFAILFYFAAMYFRLEYYLDLVFIVESFAIVAAILFVLVSDWFLKFYDYRHKNNASKGRKASLICFIILLGLIAFGSIYFYMTDFYQVVILLSIAAMMFLVVFLDRYLQIYKKEGQEKLGKILGLKNFIEVAEADRIKMLVDENPNIFYEILPYASVLGVSDKWINKLEVIKQSYPIENVNNVVLTLALYNGLIRNANLNLVRAARVARVANAAGAISLGRNGGNGGSKGGSNFGGIRRR